MLDPQNFHEESAPMACISVNSLVSDPDAPPLAKAVARHVLRHEIGASGRILGALSDGEFNQLVDCASEMAFGFLNLDSGEDLTDLSSGWLSALVVSNKKIETFALLTDVLATFECIELEDDIFHLALMRLMKLVSHEISIRANVPRIKRDAMTIDPTVEVAD